jgi:hypothetical protein
MSRRNAGGVVAVIDFEVQAQGCRLAASFRNRHTLKDGHLHLGAMDRKVHRRNGRKKSDSHQDHNQRCRAKKAHHRMRTLPL